MSRCWAAGDRKEWHCIWAPDVDKQIQFGKSISQRGNSFRKGVQPGQDTVSERPGAARLQRWWGGGVGDETEVVERPEHPRGRQAG